MAGLPALKQLKGVQSDLVRVQEYVRASMGPILAKEIVNGLLLQSVALVAGVNTIQHKLGRQLVGWEVSRIRSVTLSPPVWTDVTGGIGYQNSWVDFSSTRKVSYTIDASGLVSFRGAMKSGTINTVAFTLPTAYATTMSQDFAVQSNGAFGMAQAQTNGDITPAVGNNTSMDLSPVRFYAAAPPVQCNGSLVPIFETSAPDKNYLYLTAAAAITADLWIF